MNYLTSQLVKLLEVSASLRERLTSVTAYGPKLLFYTVPGRSLFGFNKRRRRQDASSQELLICHEVLTSTQQ